MCKGTSSINVVGLLNNFLKLLFYYYFQLDNYYFAVLSWPSPPLSHAELNVPQMQVYRYMSQHHQSHALSSYEPSDFSGYIPQYCE